MLSDLSTFWLRHRVLLYADNVIIFARSEQGELSVVRAILDCFGAASDLVVNFTKSACPVKEFPCSYLGLPLSVRKLNATGLG